MTLVYNWKKIHTAQTILGTHVRYVQYKPPLIVKLGQNTHISEPDPEKELENRSRALRRARQTLYDLVDINTTDPERPVFVTLTFANQSKDYHHTTTLLRKALRHLRRQKARFVFIAELHDSGNIHYHGVVWTNFTTLPTWKKIWPHGGIDVQLVDGIKDISAYITKYMTKQSLDWIPHKKPMYICSRNLKRPETVYNTSLHTEASEVLYSSISEEVIITKYAIRNQRFSS